MSETVFGRCPRCHGPLVACYCPKDGEQIAREALRREIIKRFDRRRNQLHGVRDTGWRKLRGKSK